MKVYHKKSKSYVELDSVKHLNRTGKTETKEGVRCAVMKQGNEHFLVPWDNISFLKVKGEKNVSAKLKTDQVREMIVDYYTQKGKDITHATLAAKYGVHSDTIANILKGAAWCHVSIPTIRQVQGGNLDVNKVVKAKNNFTRNSKLKLNANMAKFIVRDHYVNKFKIRDLANKFCVSVRSIQRIVSGRAWCEVTIPAIAEYRKKPELNAFGLPIH